MLETTSIWVLGTGSSGGRAVRLLRDKHPSARIVGVDLCPLRPLAAADELVRGEAASWLADNLPAQTAQTLVVPAVPIHLAVEWLRRVLPAMGVAVARANLPDRLLARLPNGRRTRLWQAVASHADFLCPVDCPEPEERCSHTGLPRAAAMYELLETLSDRKVVTLAIRSRQFAAGVGGFHATDLWRLLDRVKRLRGQEIFVGTACRCHGILDGLRLG